MFCDQDYINMEEGNYNIKEFILDKMENGFLYPFGIFYIT